MTRVHSALLKISSGALCFFCVLLLTAQSTLQRRPAETSDYILGSGDKLVLHVTDMDEITDKPLTIDPSGYVDLPLAGRIKAGGLTLQGFKAELAQKLSTYITSPEISVNLDQSSSQPVSVVGEVNSPGVHQLLGMRRLLEVLSLSGGLKADAGPNVLVTREPQYGGINSSHAKLDAASGYTTATFSLDELMTARTPADNILIEPNDVISVPRAELIYVVGDVHKAGGFQLSTHPTLSLLQAISLAEGLGPDNSASHARILRQEPGGDGTPKEIPVDVNKIFAGKAPDLQLRPNDILFIPHSGTKVASRRIAETALGLTTGLLIYR